MKYLAVCILIVGCASQPPQPPLTREQRILNAVSASYGAGHDGQATYDNLHLQWCLYDAQQLVPAQQSPAIAQCRANWPYHAEAAAVNTKCATYGTETHCTSQ